jgi:protein SCO1
MSTGASSTQDTGGEPRSGGAFKLVLPIVALLAILGGITALLLSGGSKTALPGNASAGKTPTFYGSTLSPAVVAPALDTLRNYDGSTFSLASERGKAVFVTFLYAHCPDVCPLIASNLHNAYARMSPSMRKRVAIVAVSVDPRGDTPGTVGAFVRQHELAGEADYLIGSGGQLAPVWKAWNVGSEQDVGHPELVNHSALIYGIGADGRIYTIYPSNFEPSEIVHDVPPLLSR